MKRIVLATATLLLAAGCWSSALAQTKLPPRRTVAPKAKATAPKGVTMKEGFTVKEGKVLVTRNGLTSTVAQPEKLVNGTTIKSDGTVILRDSTHVMMKEGDELSLSGRLTTKAMQAEQDSLMNVVKENTKMKLKSKRKGR
ncbi:DUF6799 domain-containing protein [Hymenobacter guriensis]|uniref:DUF6799 domain-containing protein n=1 Tax=Hymenobacter guriensis TaxID=2793065 RepID=A0ABS0L536_9BACT|nr:DUF6799 domain-containing protein [Hymenobacter guriensis]MBG8555245.1 hypothetical protein [Hymenobacter guriensis]